MVTLIRLGLTIFFGLFKLEIVVEIALPISEVIESK